MGLDFSVSDAHWSYSGFHTFRERVAREIGIDLNSMQGFGGSISWEKIVDPISKFLYHSDCDGTITPEDCFAIYPRLRELVKDWPDHDPDKVRAL